MSMAIFNSYVSLPEGKLFVENIRFRWMAIVMFDSNPSTNLLVRLSAYAQHLCRWDWFWLVEFSHGWQPLIPCNLVYIPWVTTNTYQLAKSIHQSVSFSELDSLHVRMVVTDKDLDYGVRDGFSYRRWVGTWHILTLRLSCWCGKTS
jgi:hypothetical protein